MQAPRLSFRDATYGATAEPDGTVVWKRGPAQPPARATDAQVMLARAVFSKLDDSVRDAAVRIVRTHEAWFDGRPLTAAALARELRVTDVRVPTDAKDATLYARHNAFSGHIVEIGILASGRLTGVMLLG